MAEFFVDCVSPASAGTRCRRLVHTQGMHEQKATRINTNCRPLTQVKKCPPPGFLDNLTTWPVTTGSAFRSHSAAARSR